MHKLNSYIILMIILMQYLQWVISSGCLLVVVANDLLLDSSLITPFVFGLYNK